ncbi:MAG TPA: MFS transporter [Candidatus Limnocylindria bacterium]|nr:MFS transporter [Candidatus Limnocylindria bacterium]
MAMPDPMAEAHAARPRLMTGPFLLVAAASLLYFIADGLTLPIYPVFVTGPLGGDAAALGLVFGAFSVTALLLRPWSGTFADRRGRRPLLLGGAVLLVVAMLGHILVSTVEMLIVMRLVMGVSEAAFFVAAFTMASDLTPEDRRGEALSLVSLSLYAGIAIGPFIGELVLGEDRFALAWATAAALAVVAILIVLRVPETRPKEGSPEAVGQPGRYRIIHPRGVLPGFIVLAGTWGMAGYFVFAKPYGEELGLAGVAPLFLLYAGIVIVIRALMPWAPDRFGGRRLAGAALVFIIAGLVIMGGVGSPVGLYAGTVVMALGVAFFPPAILTMAQAGIPALERGALIGTTSAFIDLGFGVAPITLGLVANGAGYPVTFVVSAVIAGVGLALLLVGYRARPAPADREPDIIAA